MDILDDFNHGTTVLRGGNTGGIVIHIVNYFIDYKMMICSTAFILPVIIWR